MIESLPFILETLSSPYNIVLMLAGNVVGIIFGAIPGLSGTMAVMLFMPLTYTMDAGTAIVFLLSLWIGGCSGAFIGSVLLGIPGSASAVATCWDGYPMSLQGKSGKALAIGMTASFTGTFFSAIFGCILCVYVADIAFLLSAWEYFSLCFVAITMVIAISKGNMFKGLAAASLGLLFSSVGYSPIDAEPRFVFDNMYLMGGLGMTIVLMGIFALSRILVDFGQGYPPTPEVDTKSIHGFGITPTEVKEQGGNIVRSFLIGLGIGFLPGMGPGLSNLVAYSSAKNASKDPDSFGKGNPAGVWAPEVANNAAIGGALIPMAALGIHDTRPRDGPHGISEQWPCSVPHVCYCGSLCFDGTRHADLWHAPVSTCPQDPAALHVSCTYSHLSYEFLCGVRQPLQMRHDVGILRYRCGDELWRIADQFSHTRLCSRAHT